jgi:hypothetical protein
MYRYAAYRLENLMSSQHRNRVPAVWTSSNRKVFDFKQTKFWAERGLIHTVHETTGEYTTCSVREWLLRAQALSRQAWREKYADEREQIITLVEVMVKVARQAKAQGDPFTQEGVAEAVQRMPTQVMLPDVFYSHRGEERRAGTEPLVLPDDSNPQPRTPPSDPWQTPFLSDNDSSDS